MEGGAGGGEPHARVRRARGGRERRRSVRGGAQALRRRPDPRACDRFEASLRLDPALGTLQNLATCHEQEGRTARAHAEFERLAEQAAKAGPGQKAREIFGRKHAAALSKKLSQVELQLGADANVAAIRIDGDPLPREAWNAPVALDPGTHSIVFDTPGKQPVTQTIVVAAAPSAVPLVVPHLEGVPPPPPPPPPPVRGIPLRTVAYALGGAGAVGIVLGSTFGGLTFAEKGAAAPHCSGMYCDAQGLSLQNQAYAYATASTTAFVLGLAAGGAGAFLFVWGGPDARLSIGATSPGSTIGMRVDGTW